MTACNYCGRENPDQAERCSQCGTPLRSSPESTPGSLEGPPDRKSFPLETSQKPVTPWLKWFLWLLAWGLVVTITAVEHPEDFQGTVGFPFGLLGFLPINGTTGFFILLASPAVIICGWLMYLKLTIAIHKAKTVERFSRLYFLLCVLLLLNLAGCRVLITTGASIH